MSDAGNDAGDQSQEAQREVERERDFFAESPEPKALREQIVAAWFPDGGIIVEAVALADASAVLLVVADWLDEQYAGTDIEYVTAMAHIIAADLRREAS